MFFFNDTATTEIYTLSLHDALPIWRWCASSARTSAAAVSPPTSSGRWRTRIGCSASAIRSASRPRCAPSTRRSPPTQRSEEHTSELQSRQYLVCRLLLEKKNNYDDV